MPALDRYFDVLLEKGGSDLHLSIGYPPMIRAKGELVPIANEPLDHPAIVRLMDEIINDPDSRATRAPQGGRRPRGKAVRSGARDGADR